MLAPSACVLVAASFCRSLAAARLSMLRMTANGLGMTAREGSSAACRVLEGTLPDYAGPEAPAPLDNCLKGTF
jgi:hypothetical protein